MSSKQTYTYQRAVAEPISFTEKEYVLTQRWVMYDEYVLTQSIYFCYKPNSWTVTWVSESVTALCTVNSIKHNSC